MIKHFCDECGKELSNEELRFSLDMLNKELCAEHATKYIEEQTNVKWVKHYEPLNADDIAFRKRIFDNIEPSPIEVLKLMNKLLESLDDKTQKKIVIDAISKYKLITGSK